MTQFSVSQGRVCANNAATSEKFILTGPSINAGAPQSPSASTKLKGSEKGQLTRS